MDVSRVRIIAGRYKGCRLVAPVGDVARPTTDRVKESMFNLMGIHWEGGTALDLFAGSGALGLEAVSRGADKAVFVDTHPKSIAAMRENIARCQRAGDSDDMARFEVWRTDWTAAWRRAEEAQLSVGWVFVDPPYKQNLWPAVLLSLGQGPLPILHGVVCEHPKNTVLPRTVGHLEVDKSKVYGDIAVTLYRYRGDL